MRAVARLGLAALGLAVSATEARAHGNTYPPIAIHHGAICRSVNGSEVTDISYSATGMRNTNAAARTVICPLVRPRFNPTQTPAQRNLAVWGSHGSANVTTTCTAYFYGETGTFYGSQTLSTSGAAGNWLLNFTFTEAQSPSWAMAAVLCRVPGAQAGLIRQVTMYPYPNP